MTIQMFIDDPGNISSLFVGDSVAKESNNVLKANVFLVIEALKQDIDIADDTLLIDTIFNAGIHSYKILEVYFFLLGKYFLKNFRPN